MLLQRVDESPDSVGELLLATVKAGDTIVKPTHPIVQAGNSGGEFCLTLGELAGGGREATDRQRDLLESSALFQLRLTQRVQESPVAALALRHRCSPSAGATKCPLTARAASVSSRSSTTLTPAWLSSS